MRKLWKHEWRYHICFLLLIVIAVFIKCDIGLDGEFYIDYVRTSAPYSVERVSDSLSMIAGWIMYGMLNGMVWLTLVGILLKKVFIYWIEKDSSGREFFETIPVGKKERYRFHMYMDMITVVFVTLIHGLFGYNRIQGIWMKCDVELPWMAESYVGMMLTVISYMVMILSVLYLLENIFVDGVVKIIGIPGMAGMMYYLVEALFARFSGNVLVQGIYGFLTMNSAGGCRYRMLSANDTGMYQWGEMADWMHDRMFPQMLYRGEWVEISNHSYSQEVAWLEMSEINRLYDFSNLQSYIFHVLGYLLIGAIVIGITYHLVSRREASKTGFYFGFGRYLFSCLLALTFYAVVSIGSAPMWQKLLQVVGTLIIFMILLYFMNPQRTTGLYTTRKGSKKG